MRKKYIEYIYFSINNTANLYGEYIYYISRMADFKQNHSLTILGFL